MDFVGLLKSPRRSLPPVFYIYKHYLHKSMKNITFYTAFALVVQPENHSDQRFMQTDSDTTQIAKFMGPTWGPPGSCRPHEPCYQGRYAEDTCQHHWSLNLILVIMELFFFFFFLFFGGGGGWGWPVFHQQNKEGILPKGPYLPCVSMAGRALLARYVYVYL